MNLAVKSYVVVNKMFLPLKILVDSYTKNLVSDKFLSFWGTAQNLSLFESKVSTNIGKNVPSA